MTKEFKSLKTVTYIELAAAAVLSLFSIHFALDISLIAFPLSIGFTGILGFLFYSKLEKNSDGSKLFVVLKMTQYLPYVLLLGFIFRRAGKHGTGFIYDIITVLLWFTVFVLSLICSHKMSEKKLKNLCADWKIKPVFKKPTGAKRIVFEIVDWIDALIWAIFTVLLFQIFIFQLYEIPSESMVPTFLIKDRVIVSKIDCGPKFPLTNVGLPDLRKYKRGDTIVLRNPHYSMDRKSEVKTVTSQLIYMLTFMSVNINKDENGELKADPLVKRICGEPGEQLVMQDGQLYARTKNSDFKPVEIDNKYATWNLNSLNQSTKRKVQYFPFSATEYENMLDFEEQRRNYDLSVAEFQAEEIVRQIKAMAYNQKDGKFNSPNLFEFQLFSKATSIAAAVLSQNGGTEWFESFMTSWIPSKNNVRDMYAESNYKLNVMSKITFGKLVLRSAQLLKDSASDSQIQNDEEIQKSYQNAQVLNWYIQSLLDERNMPVFPANDSAGNPVYMPKNCYFMMGDNRFNSLDLRHSLNQDLKPLTSEDPLSVKYYSMIEPQYINKKYIIGKPIYRFWPATRRGKV